jgi:glutamyl-tRNA reductase
MSNHIEKAIAQIKNGKDSDEVLEDFSKKLVNVLLHPIRLQIKTGSMEYRDILKSILDKISLDNEDELL